MKEYTIKRLWNGLATFRDYQIEKWMRKKETLKVVTPSKPGEYMIVRPADWSRAFQAVHGNIERNGKTFKMFDMRWRDDSKKEGSVPQ